VLIAFLSCSLFCRAGCFSGCIKSLPGGRIPQRGGFPARATPTCHVDDPGLIPDNSEFFYLFTKKKIQKKI